LWIYDNSVLENIEGLANISPASIYDLNIYNNPMLSHCEITAICDYLLNPTGTVVIYNNAPGCNNPSEIAAACLALSTPQPFPVSEFSISPNPIRNSAKVEYTLKESSTVILQIFDINGLVVTTCINEFQPVGRHIAGIDFSEINRGVYFCVLQTNEGIKTRKMMLF